jgi:hypothetical protein
MWYGYAVQQQLEKMIKPQMSIHAYLLTAQSKA